MINEIIVRYLTENKRLVIPGFGAFIRKDGEGETVFVEFLKKDDQVLTSLLEKEYGLSTAEALSAAADYAEQVRRQTGAGERYLIPGLGWLRTDANGVTDLDYNPGAKAASAAKAAGQNMQAVPRPAARIEQAASAPAPAITSAAQTAAATAEKPRSASGMPGTVASPAAEPVKPRPAVVSPIRPAGKPAPNRIDPVRPKDYREPGPGNYKQQVRSANGPGKKKRADLIMIIAIVAAVIAIISMVYGIFVDSAPDINLQKIAPVEQADTTLLQN